MFTLYRKDIAYNSPRKGRWQLVGVFHEIEFSTIYKAYRWDPTYQIRRIR